MKITILNSTKIEKVPSGSGITKLGEIYYVIGDDSQFLFYLDKEFKTISKLRIFESVDSPEERIIKSKKPDFEAIELITDTEVVIFGSGSKSPERNIFLRILLGDSPIIEKYDISDFYIYLRNLPAFDNSELNIETTAFHDNQLFLFNRSKNLILKFEYSEVLEYLKGNIVFPTPEVTAFILPKINGIEAGFSGATALKSEPKILFTASVENTDNAYDDGEILGSFVGMIDISNHVVSSSFVFVQIPNSEEKLKVESITVEEEISSGKTKVALITDDDKGHSLLIESVLLW
jgi:hypothetical protein